MSEKTTDTKDVKERALTYALSTVAVQKDGSLNVDDLIKASIKIENYLKGDKKEKNVKGNR